MAVPDEQTAALAVSGRAYPLTDHRFDVVVNLRARWADEPSRRLVGGVGGGVDIRNSPQVFLISSSFRIFGGNFWGKNLAHFREIFFSHDFLSKMFINVVSISRNFLQFFKIASDIHRPAL